MAILAPRHHQATAIQDPVHDLRNLLAVIASSVDLLQDRAGSDFDALLLHAIDRATRRGGTIVAELLSQVKTADGRRIDLNSVVADLQPELVAILGRRINLSIDLCTDALPTKLDARDVENALLELVLNAHRALPGSGGVTIRSRRIGARGWLIVADSGRCVARATSPKSSPVVPPHRGLPRIDRWLHAVHGRRYWRSAIGAGTIVALDLPLQLGRRLISAEPQPH